MSITNGMNHLGLSVSNLDQSVSFFVDHLGGRKQEEMNLTPDQQSQMGLCGLLYGR
jgi:catechol 2,3-dioxygenase-like lactoylglutathione lyase family enzyme